MNALRFERIVAWLLLVVAVVYTLVMHSYEADAGRVPSIISAAMAILLVAEPSSGCTGRG